MDIFERFARTLRPDESEILQHVRSYIAWQMERTSNFQPSSFDDVSLRTYLLSLQTGGISPSQQHQQMASLRRFYDWTVTEGLLGKSPFESFSVERPRLNREQIRRREETITGTSEEREIARLRALNRLTEQLNRSADVQTALDTALETVASLMGLETAWAFLLPVTDDFPKNVTEISNRDFSLACAYGLPPGLEQNNRYHINNQDGCHCQDMVKSGKMTRAVNIVECTRLRASAADNGDNQGLMFHASVPIIASGRPRGIINVATREWQFLTSYDLQMLSMIGKQVAIALERAYLYDVAHAQRLRLERELKMAREVQESLLPDHLPQVTNFSLAADWRSALETAGDFYDIFELPNGNWGIVIADVSDKGAAAAMYMAMTHSLVRASAGLILSPAEVLMEVNQRLIAHSSSVMFVTMFYGVLDAEARSITYANAGQNPPLFRRATGKLKKITRTGTALGILEELQISEATLTLAAGDALIIYTDGFTDALNQNGQDYGMERLMEAVGSAPPSNAADILDFLSRDLAAFVQERPLFDDITLFILVSEGEHSRL